MPADIAAPTLQYYLADNMRIGTPDAHGPLTVFPLFGPPPRLEYVAFAQGVQAGVVIRELEKGAQVSDLLVINPTDVPVLLFEGEEVIGAQQNRTFDTSVLVPAGERLQVPVSCVEAGRWDGSRAHDQFAPAPQTAYPALRRLKNEAVRINAMRGHEPRAEQGEVWSEVAAKSARLETASMTGAMHDVFEGRRERLDEFVSAITLHEGQTGAIAAIGGKATVLDHVSRPDVFAAPHGPLVQGYALDALEATDEGPVDDDAAHAFLRAVLASRLSEHDGIGLGRDVRFADRGVSGSGLVAGDEVVQVSAFAEGDGSSAVANSAARIRRPSRRLH